MRGWLLQRAAVDAVFAIYCFSMAWVVDLIPLAVAFVVLGCGWSVASIARLVLLGAGWRGQP